MWMYAKRAGAGAFLFVFLVMLSSSAPLGSNLNPSMGERAASAVASGVFVGLFAAAIGAVWGWLRSPRTKQPVQLADQVERR